MGSLMKFGIVGVVQNGLSLLMILLLLVLGLAPYQAFAIVFPLAVIATYWLNSRWTFSNRKRSRATPVAYAVTYCVAYLFTLACSYLLEQMEMVDWMNAIATMIATGVLTFLLLDLQVFRTPTNQHEVGKSQ